MQNNLMKNKDLKYFQKKKMLLLIHQIEYYIQKKYNFINYNGWLNALNKKKFKKMLI